jgi:hypothetical protein
MKKIKVNKNKEIEVKVGIDQEVKIKRINKLIIIKNQVKNEHFL